MQASMDDESLYYIVQAKGANRFGWRSFRIEFLILPVILGLLVLDHSHRLVATLCVGGFLSYLLQRLLDSSKRHILSKLI
jgi:hypothetical protein